MKRNNFVLLTLITSCFLFHQAFSQSFIRCSTVEIQDLYEQKYPGTKERIEQLRNVADEWVKNHPAQTRSVITVPVVVHVVWHTPVQNISDDQIKSQIEVLNEDYASLNWDTVNTPDIYKPIRGNPMIQFCLAAVDPDGNLTSGITRTETDVTEFKLNELDKVKSSATGGIDGWPMDSYLNIWTCNLESPYLGYGTLPGTSSDGKDGVVVLYRAFGRDGFVIQPYDLGRTCTHEVGHWLGLRHIWGDDNGACSGSDGIHDTPNQADANYGCPDFPHITCNNEGDMSMNYMDYTNDACMNMFTQDQAAEMYGVLNSSRSAILSSTAGCNSTIVYTLDARMFKVIEPFDTVNALSFAPYVQISNQGFDDLTFLHIEYQVDGQDVQSFDWTGDLPSALSINVYLPLAFTGEGGHIFTAWCSQPNHGTDQYLHNDTANSEFTVVSSIEKNTITLGPVPTSGLLNIKIENPGGPDLELRVVNDIGQVVMVKNLSLITNSNFTLDLSNLANGIYFLQGKIYYDYIQKKVMVWK